MPRAKTTPAKTAEPKGKGRGRPKSKPVGAGTNNYPKLVLAAIIGLKERGGSSHQAIYKYMAANNTSLPDAFQNYVKRAINKLIEGGQLVTMEGKKVLKLSDSGKKAAAVAAAPKKDGRGRPKGSKNKKPKEPKEKPTAETKKPAGSKTKAASPKKKTTVKPKASGGKRGRPKGSTKKSPSKKPKKVSEEVEDVD